MDWSFIGVLIIAALTIFGWGFAAHVVFTQSERALRRKRALEREALRQAAPRQIRDIVA